MIGVKSRNSSRDLFKRSGISQLLCEYIFSFMNFIVNNEEYFQTSSAVHHYHKEPVPSSQTELPISHVLRTVHTMMASTFQQSTI
jgi:hypothetical protein